MKFACDFETTTNPDDCRVWAWGCREVDYGDEYTGKDIESFIQWCKGHDQSTLYFHNLKFDGGFIVDWLLRNGYTWTKEKKLKEKEFGTLITKQSQWYYINIRFEDYKGLPTEVKIYDSLKFIPASIAEMPKQFGLEAQKLEIDYDRYRPIGYEMDAQEREYLLADIRILAAVIKIMHDNGMQKMTTASNALAAFRQIYGKRYRYDFPTLSNDEDADLRKTYKGGFTYLNPVYKDKLIGEGAVYDVNSMYPWAMTYCALPYGKPVFFKGAYKPSKIYDLYTITIRCSFKLKPGRIPSIQIKNNWRYNDTEYLVDSGGEVVISLTCIDYELMLYNYDVTIHEYYGGYMFRSKVGVFKDYVDYWYHVKDEARSNGDKGLEKIAKLMLNSLYGKFGASKKREQKQPYLDDSDKVAFHLFQSEDAKGGYLPIATFITSYCRDKIIRAAVECGERFVYADTDSLHIVGTQPVPGLDVDNHRLGAFKLEETFIRAKFLRQKTYYEIIEKEVEGLRTEHMNLKAAGMPDNVKGMVTEANFKIGEVFGSNLKPRIVPGGVILREQTYSIKGGKVDK